MRRASTPPNSAPASRARAFAAASGGAGERLCIAHQGAQVGVLPLLDTAVRQALASNRRNAASRWAAIAPSGKPRPRRGESLGKAGLGRRLDEWRRRRHAASSWYSA